MHITTMIHANLANPAPTIGTERRTNLNDRPYIELRIGLDVTIFLSPDQAKHIATILTEATDV